MNDITRIKMLEKKMKNLSSLYFSQITHEIKTPLISIIPLLERLENYVHEERGHKILSVVRNSANQLSHFTDSIIDMTRLKHGNFEVNLDYFNIQETVSEVLSCVDFQAKEKNIEIKSTFDPSIPDLLVSD